VVRVAPGLDLLEVATELAEDNRERFERWMSEDKVGDIAPELAQAWYDRNAELWAVVVAPWVLVQDRAGHVLH